ncbi:retrovirus-related Pol polyprotein from transposon 412 [Trichonephila clavipes]|nr:retrovirus-related Pol polyprotein from transposon 412 [Trichonephila clavipes]
MADVQDLKSALLYALKLEAATQTSRRDRQPIRGTRVTLDASCESPWESDMGKLRDEFQALMVQTCPIPDQKALTVAEVLVQHWISRFGVLLQLHSDQERNFYSAVCTRLCEILAIDKTRTKALHHQSDGMVERFNRTILSNLSLLVSSNQQDWDKKLPFFLLTYRSAVHETTGYSPSQMFFGRDLRLPADLLFSRPPDAPLAPQEYIEKLQARMEGIHHLAK